MKENNEYIIGLIFTIILFLILERIAPEVGLFVRVVAILILLLIGRLLLGKLFNDH